MITEAARNEFVKRVVESCQRFAQQEIYHHELNGEFVAGYVDPMDVVDDVLSEMLVDLDDSTGYARLCLIIQGRIAERLGALGREATQANESELSLDEAPPPDSAVSRIEPEVGFYGSTPQEPTMHLEDALGDTEHDSPEGLVADRELRDLLVTRMFALPRELRNLFSAVVVDGWSVEEIATAHDESPAYVRAAVARALGELRHALTAAGTVYSGDRVRELYQELGAELTRNPRPDLSS